MADENGQKVSNKMLYFTSEVYEITKLLESERTMLLLGVKFGYQFWLRKLLKIIF